VAAFIAAQRAQHQVPQATACRALGVSEAWFYKWRHGDPSPQHARREQLKVAIARLFAAHRGTYGSPRIAADLRDEGWAVSENTVAALMRELGLAARRRRRRRSSTRQGRGRWRAPDLIGRQFAASTLNRKWYGDGTEIPTDEGKLYLDSVLDMGSRRIVGFGLGEHHDADLAEAALQMAVAVRGGKDAITEVIMHTDQGSEGGFNWSSQHLDHGGVGWDGRASRWLRDRLGCDGSGLQIGRCERRCVRRVAPSRRELCSGSSGA
jgi:putative transposase